MRLSIKYYIALGLWAVSTLLLAQDNRPTNYIGINAGGGFSNLFWGKPFNPVGTLATPLLGGGGTAGVYYEFQYKHFLLHTGVGIDYSVNRNLILVDDMTANIQEYPSMTYHYTFENYLEKNTYGVGYVPVMIGASFKQCYFLVGAKLGIVSFANTSHTQTDVKIWATDQDIVGAIENIPNHGLQDYSVTSDVQAIEMKPFNAMLSAEIGIELNKKAWKPEVEKEMDAAERYREAKRKKTFKELLHCRLSIFADYGLSNIHAYKANMIPYASENSGGLVAMRTPTDVVPHTALGYQPFKQHSLNNLLVGIKLSVQLEFPKKRSKGEDLNPYVYVYVEDELTEEPLANACVQMQRYGDKSIYEGQTDSIHGSIGQPFTPGNYWAHVSHSDYAKLDTIHFEHRDDFDTLTVALYPLQKKCLWIENALTNLPMHANVIIRSIDGACEMNLSTDSTYRIYTLLDNRMTYVATAMAEGFECSLDTITMSEDNLHIKLMPVPKKTFVLQNIHFATAETTILPSSRHALNLLAQLLDENKDLYIRIVGHTDDVGSEEDNRILSEGRAKSIFQELIDRSIESQRIMVAGRGESEPLVPNTSDANRQMNRRVEIEIISGDENVNIERLTH